MQQAVEITMQIVLGTVVLVLFLICLLRYLLGRKGMKKLGAWLDARAEEKARQKRELIQQRELERQHLERGTQARREEKEAAEKAAAELRVKRLATLQPYPILVYVRLRDQRKTDYESKVINILLDYGLTVLPWPDGVRNDFGHLQDGQLALMAATWTEEGTDEGLDIGGIRYSYTTRHFDCRIIFKPPSAAPQIIASGYRGDCVFLSTDTKLRDHGIVAEMVLDDCLIAKAADWIGAAPPKRGVAKRIKLMINPTRGQALR